ncbi:MAG TPA: endonuclease/exonuclease/phosphatase family protein [Candidatus Didemnitutus sp.]|nr:endonuclease/exonuclease/phosphatase family protein [Candidatus Didemnitutus sp.]
MAKAFSLVSWNVEHFKNQGSRVADVVALLASMDPDIFALYEVEGKDVFSTLTALMPTYQFHITEGEEVQEILIGVRGGFTAFFTQKTEFKSGNQSLRPGALLSITISGAVYTLLFLHTKSGSDPIGWGIRDDMLERALELRKILDQAAPGGRANYLFTGDLNTMGMEYAIKDRNITSLIELDKLDRVAKKRKMVRLKKDAPATWWNGPGTSIAAGDLDHVVAADHLVFKNFGGAQINVRGWTEEPSPAAQTAWIKKYSDHSPIYLEVQKV